jgi:hypothetical protein
LFLFVACVYADCLATLTNLLLTYYIGSKFHPIYDQTFGMCESTVLKFWCGEKAGDSEKGETLVLYDVVGN